MSNNKTSAGQTPLDATAAVPIRQATSLIRKPAHGLLPKLRRRLRPGLPRTVGQRQSKVSSQLTTALTRAAAAKREQGNAANHGLGPASQPSTAATLYQHGAAPILPETVQIYSDGKTNALILHGDYWEITHGGTTSILEDTRGLRYIALLIRGAGNGPVYASELVALATGHQSGTVELVNKDPVMDSLGESRLVKRLEEIGFERNSASAQNNYERVAALDEEVDRISEELQRVRAPHQNGGKRTVFNNSAERARKAVSKAISEALAKMLALPDLEPLGHHLSTAIQKGQWLSYNGKEDWHVDFQAPVAEKSRPRVASIATRKVAAAKAGVSK